MYKVVIRDVLGESEVQPYREVDLSTLLSPPTKHNGAIDATDATDAERTEPLSTLAPLLLLAAAQERAEEILAQARRQAEVLQQEAHEQGMARGREEGREEAKGELLPSLFAFAQAGQSLIVLEEQLVSRFTPEIVRLALEIAEKVMGKQVEEDPQAAAAVLERARAEIPQARQVRIWLHPADYHTLMDLRPDLVRVGEEGGRKVEVLTSEEIDRGGCRMETEMGVVDATLSTQMQEISRQMLDEE